MAAVTIGISLSLPIVSTNAWTDTVRWVSVTRNAPGPKQQVSACESSCAVDCDLDIDEIADTRGTDE